MSKLMFWSIVQVIGVAMFVGGLVLSLHHWQIALPIGLGLLLFFLSKGKTGG